MEPLVGDRNTPPPSNRCNSRFRGIDGGLDKPKAQRALLSVVDQAKAMTAGRRRRPGELAGRHRAVLTRHHPRQKKLAEAGYGGEPIVVIAPTKLADIRALSLVGADQLRLAGLKIDLQEMKFGAVVKRRTSESPPDKGSWNVFFTLIDRSIPRIIHPFGNPALRADGQGRL